jgi:hypothetical protein
MLSTGVSSVTELRPPKCIYTYIHKEKSGNVHCYSEVTPPFALIHTLSTLPSYPADNISRPYQTLRYSQTGERMSRMIGWVRQVSFQSLFNLFSISFQSLFVLFCLSTRVVRSDSVAKPSAKICQDGSRVIAVIEVSDAD